MFGVDTNVLVRYLVRDDPEQTAEAVEFLEKRCSPKASGFINGVVLCETVWVLGRFYRYTDEQIARCVEGLLRADELVVEADVTVWRALRLYANTNVGLADCLIAEINAAAGAETTFTFDRKAALLPGFTLLGK